MGETTRATLQKNYGAWLASAMRAARLDIDRQRGGGRKILAAQVGVSPSSVTRWLEGQTLPDTEHLQPIADALGVPAITMLVETGIVRA